MGREYDLGAAKRARAEKRGDPPVILFGEPEQRFELGTELGVDFLEYLDANQILPAIRCAFPDEGEAQRFFALKPSIEDLVELANALTDMYLGSTPGESEASGSSSTQSSGSSRQRSKSATASS